MTPLKKGSGAEAMLKIIYRRGNVPTDQLYCLVRRVAPSIRRHFFSLVITKYGVVTAAGSYSLPQALVDYFKEQDRKDQIPDPNVAAPRSVNRFTPELSAYVEVRRRRGIA